MFVTIKALLMHTLVVAKSTRTVQRINILEIVKKHKHLGITITSNLSWASHIDELLSHVSPMADVMTKLKYQIDRKSVEDTYFSFMRPKLEYACHIWDNCSGKDADLLTIFNLTWLELFVGLIREQVMMQYLRNWVGSL